MIVLGFDTATASTAVALLLDVENSADGPTVTDARDDPRAGEHPGHATRLLDMAAQLLKNADVSWGDIDRIAVGVGPGTFTGLRVGVATARGLAQSLSVDLVGISSLQALVAGAFYPGAAGDNTAGGSGGAGRGGSPRAQLPETVLAVIDARRGEVFAAAYQRGPDGVPLELTVPRALAPEDLAGVVQEAREGHKSDHGSEARHDHDNDTLSGWLAVGDGAIRFRAQLQHAGISTPPDSSPLHLLSAAEVCRLAVAPTAEPARSVEEIAPDYRRRPDAELALETAAQGSASEP